MASSPKQYVTKSGYVYSFLFPFEEQYFDDNHVRSVMAQFGRSAYLSYAFAAIYLVTIFALKWHMDRTKSKYGLSGLLALWSAILAVFSIMGTVRFLPEFAYKLNKYGFEHSVCNNDYTYQVTGVWGLLFALSKLPELVDTLFVVLRGQKLIFLHYYHHASVLIYCWIFYPEYPSTGQWFIVMNYFIHAIMYTYYTLKALRIFVPKQISILITTLQILQMVVGCYVNYSVYRIKTQTPGVTCSTTMNNVIWSLLMYASYFILFTNFFLRAYVFKSKKQPLKAD